MAAFKSGSSENKAHEATGMMRWLLTYADLITLLLIVFIIMYAYSQVDQQKFEAAAGSLQRTLGGSEKSGGDGILKNNRQRRQRSTPNVEAIAPTTFGVSSEEIAQMKKMKESFEQAFTDVRKEGKSSGATLSITERGLVISFSGQILFDLGKANIKPEMVPILLKTSEILKTITNPVRIEGYTDNIPIKTSYFPSNWELSTARATNVLRFLIERGGLSPERLSAAGYGEHKPSYPNTSEKNRALNRRVDVVLLYQSLSVQEPE